MKNWYNYETSDLDVAELLKAYLHDDMLVKFETSGCFNCIHFEVFCDRYEEIVIDAFLEGIARAKERFQNGSLPRI